MFDKPLIAHIETLAAKSWPAEVTEPLGPWQLRFNHGLTKRANSVLALGSLPDEPDWLERVERCYRAHGLPPRFHVSDASPAELDPWLEQQGYVKEVPCHILVADCAEVLRRLEPEALRHPEPEAMPGIPPAGTLDANAGGASVDSDAMPATGSARPFPACDCRLEERADAGWVGDFLQIEHLRPDWLEAYQRLFDRIPPRKCFLRVYRGNAPVGVGTAVADGDWAGLLNVATAEAYRGQGIGRQIVRALCAWSCGQGVRRLYLQVVADNTPALRLYARAGFRHLSDYHYRVKPNV